MRAVLLATGRSRTCADVPWRDVHELLPLVDRPMLQVVIETLVHMGVDHFDVVLSESPEALRTLLGDGSRWGCSITTHLVSQPEHPCSVFPRLNLADDEAVLLGRGDGLAWPPPVPGAASGNTESRTLCTPDGTWTGWGWVTARDLSAVQPEWSHLELARWAVALDRHAVAPLALESDTFEHLLAAQANVLDGTVPDLLFEGHEAEPGIRIGRNVVLHPTARIVAPVSIAPDCRIEAGCRVGPNVVVVGNCVIDSRCTLENALILPGSYLGENLEVRDAVVDRARLIHVRHGAALTLTDPFILGSTSRRGLELSLRALLSRLAGVLLLLLAWPLLLVAVATRLMSRSGSVWQNRRCVRQPVPAPAPPWPEFKLVCLDPEPCAATPLQHLILHFVPGLLNVAAGHCALVGVRPRSREDLAALPEDWRGLAATTKAGLLTETYLVYGPGANDDEAYATEAFYSVRGTCWYDLRLLTRYATLVGGLGGRPQRNANGETVP